MNNSEYKVEKSLKAGSNSSYIIKHNDNKSAIAFDSEENAVNHIQNRISLGQDPMSISVDYDKMAAHFLNN
jgi:hypothetical protein